MHGVIPSSTVVFPHVHHYLSTQVPILDGSSSCYSNKYHEVDHQFQLHHKSCMSRTHSSQMVGILIDQLDVGARTCISQPGFTTCIVSCIWRHISGGSDGSSSVSSIALDLMTTSSSMCPPCCTVTRCGASVWHAPLSAFPMDGFTPEEDNPPDVYDPLDAIGSPAGPTAGVPSP